MAARANFEKGAAGIQKVRQKMGREMPRPKIKEKKIYSQPNFSRLRAELDICFQLGYDGRKEYQSYEKTHSC